MVRRNVRKRFLRTVMTLSIGGTAFQLSGCDPAVRGVLLEGLEATTGSLSTALISAFFLSLDDGNGGSSDLTTT